MDDLQQGPLYSLNTLFTSGDSEHRDIMNPTLGDSILRSAEKNRLIKNCYFFICVVKKAGSRIQYQAVLQIRYKHRKVGQARRDRP